jgi:GxxExxY protein
MRVHSALGPGLLEKAYTACLAYELRKADFEVQVEWSSRFSMRACVLK